MEGNVRKRRSKTEIMTDASQRMIKTTIAIPKEEYIHLKNKGYSIYEIFKLGLLAKEENPQIIDRLKQMDLRLAFLERQNEKLLARVSYLETYKQETGYKEKGVF